MNVIAGRDANDDSSDAGVRGRTFALASRWKERGSEFRAIHPDGPGVAAQLSSRNRRAGKTGMQNCASWTHAAHGCDCSVLALMTAEASEFGAIQWRAIWSARWGDGTFMGMYRATRGRNFGDDAANCSGNIVLSGGLRRLLSEGSAGACSDHAELGESAPRSNWVKKRTIR